MDTFKRMKIQNFREQIVQDVDIEDIIDDLISKNVVSVDEYELIKEEKTRRDKTRHLLDILPHKTIEAFDHFVNALQDPYPWISSQLQTDGSQTYQGEETSYFDTLLLGGLPRPPPNNVVRQEKMKAVGKCLSSLGREHYVVLHGMTGSGKSCLAAAALDDKQLIIEKFNGAVYWVSVGDVDSDGLLCHMTELMEKLSHHPGLDTERLQSSTNVRAARNSLRRYFLSTSLREGLLVLDDVKSMEIIEAFDIGCKILVTTKDSAVMKSVEGRHELVQVSEGFTEQESLCLFAKCVQVDIPQLPSQAKKIHKLCKGVPMVIALIGAQLAQNRDDVQRNSGRWDYYVDRLTKRDFGIIKRSSFSQESGLLGAIGLCVDNLPNNMKNFYQDFALFVEDVNIKPEMLGTLWSKNKYEVEDIMSEFLKKSLAVSKWNEQLNSYVYGIHDLLLCYLKMQLSHEDKVALHKKLLDCYTSVCKGNFSDLPNDNYIFSYIGHHLCEAEMWSFFPKLYLDLEFIGAKLKVTGPGDLLVDYKKYSKFIIDSDEYRQAVFEYFKQFVQTHGLDLHKYQDLDIIQCGLQEPHSSYVYEEALKIAKQRPKKLYLEFLLDQDTVPQPHTLALKEEVFAACFTTQEKKILIANGSGVINLWDTDYAQILCSFPGHKQTVVHLELSPNKRQFLSCSEDYTVKLWNLEGAICKNKDEEEFDEHGCALKTPSPRMRQYNWSNMFSNDKGGDRSHMTFIGHENHVSYATYSQNGEEVISCSKDGSVKVWNCETGEIRLTFQIASEHCFAKRCIFSGDESLIFFGGDEKIIYAYENSTGNFVTSFNTCGSVIGIMNIAADEIAVVTDNFISIWSWDSDTTADTLPSAQMLIRKNSPDRVRQLNGAKKKDTSSLMVDIKCEQLVNSDNASYTCAILSQDERYIIVGASDYSIRLWDVEEHRLVKQYKGHTGWVMCLDTFLGSSYQLLLSGSDDKTAKIWHIELAAECEAECKLKLEENFDVLWDGKSSDPYVPLLVASDNQNKLQFLRGRSFVTESIPETVKVKTCKITSNGDFVVYGCCDGLVKLFDMKKKTSSDLMKLNGAVHYLQLCYSDGLIIIAAGEDESLKIRRGKLNEIGSVVTCAGQTARVIQCFLISMGQKLLSCAQDGSVKIWETSTGNLIDVLVGRHSEAHVTMTDLSQKEDLLVLCDASGNFLVTHLEETSFTPYLTTKGNKSFNMKDSIRSCKLSHDARFLALGQDNGNIIIWDVMNELTMGTLKLHKSWVRSLLFAPPSVSSGTIAVSTPPMILVSVADQIGWWDISRLSLTSCAQQRRMSSGQRKKRRSGDSPKLSLNLDNSISDPLKSVSLADEWLGKEGPTGKVELLGCVKLIGRQADKISASKDFSAFATVDASGIVYLMKVLK